jgi:hypothetical protein
MLSTTGDVVDNVKAVLGEGRGMLEKLKSFRREIAITMESRERI